MKFFPMSCLMLGVIGISACGGGSSSGSNQTEAQVTPTENEQDVTSVNSNTNSKVEDQIYGYEFSYFSDGSNIIRYEQTIENETSVNNITGVAGKVSDVGYEYPVLTKNKKFNFGRNVVDNKITYLGLKVVKLTDTLLSEKSLDDETLVLGFTFDSYDISGKKITDVLTFSGSFKASLDSLPSTQNTFGTKQSCKYLASESSSIDYMEYDEVFKENAQLSDLQAEAASFLSENTISGEWLGKPWIANIDKQNDESYADGLILDNGKVHNVSYYPAGKTTLRFNGCEIFTKAQADFIVAAIKAVSNQP